MTHLSKRDLLLLRSIVQYQIDTIDVAIYFPLGELNHLTQVLENIEAELDDLPELDNWQKLIKTGGVQ